MNRALSCLSSAVLCLFGLFLILMMLIYLVGAEYGLAMTQTVSILWNGLVPEAPVELEEHPPMQTDPVSLEVAEAGVTVSFRAPSESQWRHREVGPVNSSLGRGEWRCTQDNTSGSLRVAVVPVWELGDITDVNVDDITQVGVLYAKSVAAQYQPDDWDRQNRYSISILPAHVDHARAFENKALHRQIYHLITERRTKAEERCPAFGESFLILESPYAILIECNLITRGGELFGVGTDSFLGRSLFQYQSSAAWPEIDEILRTLEIKKA